MSIAKPTFKISMGDFVGVIGNMENFRKNDITVRADLLQDWLVDLQDEYDATLEEMNTKKTKNTIKLMEKK
jgi:hypothetical protein